MQPTVLPIAKYFHQVLRENEPFPNNPKLPLLLYKEVLDLKGDDDAATVEQVFQENDWSNCWRDGIFTYHHYHSITHEVLGVYSGSCEVQAGGDKGVTFTIEKGDVLIIPAGVAHKNISSTKDFKCVGAYPGGHDYDMNYGKPGERPGADENISNVPMPGTDPVYGENGPMMTCWTVGCED